MNNKRVIIGIIGILILLVIINGFFMFKPVFTGNVVLNNIEDIEDFENWEYMAMPDFFDAPTGELIENDLTIRGSSNFCSKKDDSMTPCEFGYWTSSPNTVELKKDVLYKFVFHVSFDQYLGYKAPEFRIRINDLKERVSQYLDIRSPSYAYYDEMGNKRIGGLGIGRQYYFAPSHYNTMAYEFYFKPPINSEYYLNFDMVNFDKEDSGGLTLHNLKVREIKEKYAEEEVYGFNVNDWQPITMSEFFDEPVLNKESGKLKIKGSGGECGTGYVEDGPCEFGFWTTSENLINYETEELYKLKFKLSSDLLESEIDKVPQIRLRMNTHDAQLALVYVISSFGNAELSPVSSKDKKYELYFKMPNVGQFNENKKIYFSFDYVNFDANDNTNAEITLKDVQLTKVDLDKELMPFSSGSIEITKVYNGQGDAEVYGYNSELIEGAKLSDSIKSLNSYNFDNVDNIYLSFFGPDAQVSDDKKIAVSDPDFKRIRLERNGEVIEDYIVNLGHPVIANMIDSSKKYDEKTLYKGNYNYNLVFMDCPDNVIDDIDFDKGLFNGFSNLGFEQSLDLIPLYKSSPETAQIYYDRCSQASDASVDFNINVNEVNYGYMDDSGNLITGNVISETNKQITGMVGENEKDNENADCTYDKTNEIFSSLLDESNYNYDEEIIKVYEADSCWFVCDRCYDDCEETETDSDKIRECKDGCDVYGCHAGEDDPTENQLYNNCLVRKDMKPPRLDMRDKCGNENPTKNPGEDWCGPKRNIPHKTNFHFNNQDLIDDALNCYFYEAFVEDITTNLMPKALEFEDNPDLYLYNHWSFSIASSICNKEDIFPDESSKQDCLNKVFEFDDCLNERVIEQSVGSYFVEANETDPSIYVWGTSEQDPDEEKWHKVKYKTEACGEPADFIKDAFYRVDFDSRIETMKCGLTVSGNINLCDDESAKIQGLKERADFISYELGKKEYSNLYTTEDSFNKGESAKRVDDHFMKYMKEAFELSIRYYGYDTFWPSEDGIAFENYESFWSYGQCYGMSRVVANAFHNVDFKGGRGDSLDCDTTLANIEYNGPLSSRNEYIDRGYARFPSQFSSLNKFSEECYWDIRPTIQIFQHIQNVRYREGSLTVSYRAYNAKQARKSILRQLVDGQINVLGAWFDLDKEDKERRGGHAVVAYDVTSDGDIKIWDSNFPNISTTIECFPYYTEDLEYIVSCMFKKPYPLLSEPYPLLSDLDLATDYDLLSENHIPLHQSNCECPLSDMEFCDPYDEYSWDPDVPGC